MTATDLLEGRVAIVTGGARGIGAAISEMLIECGASVVIADSGTTIEGRDKTPRSPNRMPIASGNERDTIPKTWPFLPRPHNSSSSRWTNLAG